MSDTQLVINFDTEFSEMLKEWKKKVWAQEQTLKDRIKEMITRDIQGLQL